ncbi:MAG: SIMPL domain-containing protein, partial [Bacteroidota bacterium]
MKLFAVFLSVSTLLILPQVSFSQRSGNQVYGNNNYYNNKTISSLESVYSTDTSLVISSKILLNKAPDLLVVSLGIQEEGKTVKICNEAITARINKLFENLKSIEIKKEDFYVDFISQAKLYDFETAQNKIEQFEKGFEIKKNIIIRLNKPSDFDKLIELCAEQEIYDIIKADYINTEVEKIYSEMYNEGVKIVEWKKKRYLQNSNQTMLSSSRIKKDQFYSIYPKTQYKQYEAVES